MAYNFGKGLSSGISGAGAGSSFGPWGAAVGGGLGLLGGFEGRTANPSDAANRYFNQMGGTLRQNFNPWIQAGQNLMQNPGERLNQIGQGYHQSPGFQFALQQALQGAGHAAAAGGMAGSPQHEQQNMQLATQIGNQDYNTWLQNALGLHNLGYQGGQQAGMGLGEDLASILAHQGQYAYAGQAGQNEGNTANWENVFSGVGNLGTNYKENPDQWKKLHEWLD